MTRQRMLRFFGRSIFLGIGGLIVSPFTIWLDASVHANLTLPLTWASICVVWVLLGMVARTRRA